jgi:hypothetical protein
VLIDLLGCYENCVRNTFHIYSNFICSLGRCRKSRERWGLGRLPAAFAFLRYRQESQPAVTPRRHTEYPLDRRKPCVVRCLNRVIPGDADGHRARQTASGESSRGTGAQYEPLTTAEIPDRCLSQRVMATAGGNMKKAARRVNTPDASCDRRRIFHFAIAGTTKVERRESS